VEYKLQSSGSYSTQEVGVRRECSIWDGFICFKLNDTTHGIAEDKNYVIRVSGIAGIFIVFEN
jgi:hypothetical protein